MLLVSFLIGLTGSGILPFATSEINKKTKLILFTILTVVYTIITYFLFKNILPDFKLEYLPGYLLISGIWWILSAMLAIIIVLKNSDQ